MTSPPVPARTTLPLRVPWTTAAGATAVAGFMILRTLTSPVSAPSTLTIRLLELGLAASAAYLLDDAAVGLTTVAPRSLWRRRALSLGIGLPMIAGAWIVVLFHLHGTPGLPLGALTIEVAVLVTAGLAASAVLARRGEPEPGGLVAVAVALAGVATTLLGGMLGFDVSISGHGAGQTEKEAAWVFCGLLALVVLWLASREASPWRMPSPRRPPRTPHR